MGTGASARVDAADSVRFPSLLAEPDAGPRRCSFPTNTAVGRLQRRSRLTRRAGSTPTGTQGGTNYTSSYRRRIYALLLTTGEHAGGFAENRNKSPEGRAPHEDA